MDWKKKIIETINSMSGKYSPYTIFYDWIKMTAISIRNACHITHDKIWCYFEKQYTDIAEKYTESEMQKFSDMHGMLVLLLQEEKCDWLGLIYMESECGNKNTGQFFTPYFLCRAIAELNTPKEDDGKIIKVHEPSTGGGGQIIAVADVLQERGINYQKRLRVTTQDIDWAGVYMTYVQISLLGINGIVVQGDTLCEPYVNGYPEEKIMRTPANMGWLL